MRGGTLVLDDAPVFTYRRHSKSVSAVTGPDGSKFRQEATLLRRGRGDGARLGWKRAARAARAHVSLPPERTQRTARGPADGNADGRQHPHPSRARAAAPLTTMSRAAPGRIGQ